jgi:hypothetical protein
MKAPSDVNWPLIRELATRPHKHLNIKSDCQFTCVTHGNDHWISEVEQEARTCHHLLDLAGVPEGKGYSAHVDARTWLLFDEVTMLRNRLDRIAGWHSRESGPAGTVGDYCNECGNHWPCETSRMAGDTYDDKYPDLGDDPDGDIDGYDGRIG